MQRKHVCVEPTLESSLASREPRKNPAAAAPRRTLFILVAATTALIGFFAGRVLSGPSEAQAAPASLPSPAPMTALAAPRPAPAPAPGVALAPDMPPAAMNRGSGLGAGGLAGSAGYVPRTIPRPHARPARKSQVAAVSAPTRVAPAIPTDAQMRDLENVTRELASSH